MHITVSGARLFVAIAGQGLVTDGPAMRQRPTRILSPGGPGADHPVCKPTMAALAYIAQVVVHDHLDNGRNDPGAPGDWTRARGADDLRGLCDALGILRPVVPGTAFGGIVALAHAQRQPGHAGGLALVSTAARVGFAQVHAAFGRLVGAEAIARACWENPTPEGRALFRQRCVPL